MLNDETSIGAVSSVPFLVLHSSYGLDQRVNKLVQHKLY